MKYKISEITVAAIFRGYCEPTQPGSPLQPSSSSLPYGPGPTIKTLRGANVKTFRLFKLPFLLCVLLGSLLLSPACRAQSEIAPDFFDGPNTEPFERVSAPAPSEAKTVAPAARLTHGIKVGKRGEITLAQAMKVGDRILKPGTYVVQHRVSHGDHFVRFKEFKQAEYWAWTDPQVNDTFTVEENVGEIKCRVEPEKERIKDTTVYTVTENGTQRITKVAIRSENVLHVFWHADPEPISALESVGKW